MIISDLNYVEVVCEASEVQGGRGVSQSISQRQDITSNAGGGEGDGDSISLVNALQVAANLNDLEFDRLFNTL